MSICSDRGEIVLPCKINVRGSDHVTRLGCELTDREFLKFPGEPSACAEFGEFKGVDAVSEAFDLGSELLFRALKEFVLVILHAEVGFVNDLEQVDLELHRREKGSFDDDGKLAVM